MLVVGVNHHKTPVAFREQLAFSESAVVEALTGLTAQSWVREAMILSTCNRSEIYVVTAEPAQAIEPLKHWWCGFLKVREASLDTYFFAHRDQAAIHHVTRVAAGLDSMVLGEPQILGQLKQAFKLAQSANAVGAVLHQVIPHSFSVAKQVRTHTKLGAHPVSVAYAAVSLSKRIFDNLGALEAVLLGAGEMIQLVARHLKEQGVSRIRVINRTQAHARRIADQIPGLRVAGLSDLADALVSADILIACTASEDPLINQPMVEQALRQRRHRPIYMVDLAVPRDIEPGVNVFEDVYLFSIDDLSQVIDENKKIRSEAAREAEQIAQVQTDAFIQNLAARKAHGLVVSYRAQMEALRQQMVERARKQIAQGQSVDAVIDQMSRLMMNKLIHAPTLAMRGAIESQNPDQLEWAQALLDVEKVEHSELKKSEQE